MLTFFCSACVFLSSAINRIFKKIAAFFYAPILSIFRGFHCLCDLITLDFKRLSAIASTWMYRFYHNHAGHVCARRYTMISNCTCFWRRPRKNQITAYMMRVCLSVCWMIFGSSFPYSISTFLSPVIRNTRKIWLYQAARNAKKSHPILDDEWCPINRQIQSSNKTSKIGNRERETQTKR